MSGEKTRQQMLFVTNTMGLAGAERALSALLEEIDKERFDLDLFSLVPLGEMFANIPASVRVLNTAPSYAPVLSKEGRRYLFKQVLRSMVRPKAFGHFLITLPRNFLWKWRRRKQASGFQMDKLCWELLADAAPRFEKTYDLAIAFLEGGATYYVAKHVKALKKAAFIHVDYQQAGYSPKQDAPYFAVFDAVFGVSMDVVRSVLQAHPSLAPRIHVFHNRVNVAKIHAQAQEPGGFVDRYRGTRLLTIARLHPQKALDVAVGAMALLRDRGFNARWYVLGDGPEEETLRTLIIQNGLEDSFLLLGSATNPYPYIAQCDIYIQASHYEGWGIAITEALALGKPVLATACAGPCEQIVSGENGILIPIPIQEKALADAIFNLAADTTLRAKLSSAPHGINPRWESEIQSLYTLATGGVPPQEWSEKP